MPNNEVIISIPSTIPDLKHLAESTSKALAVLRPWCKEGFSALTLRPIKDQARLYVKAINFSVIAAQHGFTVAQEAICFAKTMESGNENERQEYLRGMVAIASRGEENAKEACEQFRDVRVKVLGLIEKANFELTREKVEPAISSVLDDLERGTSVLEDLSLCISQYINWWNSQKMTHSALSSSTEELKVNYGALRKKTVVQKWQELMQAYTEYANAIHEIQDTDPYFATELKQARQAETQHIPHTPLVFGPAPILFGPINHFNKRAEETIKAHHRFRFWLS